MADNNNDKSPLYTVNHEKAEEYLQKVDNDIEWLENFSRKVKESGK